ncbi:hypothetical protein [Streptomyces turgidiscabies]
MSRKQDRQQSGHTCRLCHQYAGNRAICSTCSPKRGTRTHRDKYAKDTP